MKTLKEYLAGISIGPISHMAPIASLGDKPAKNNDNN